MRLSKPRIQPVPHSEWNDEQKETFKGMAEPLNIFKTLSNHPKLAKRWLVFANHILGKSSLSERDREIIILRIGWLCQSEYEWGQHVVIGKRAGLSDTEIANIKLGADAEGWSKHDQLLLRATDELHGDAFISDATWEGLAESYSQEQMMDLVFTCGQYNLVSMALNSFGVQLDKGIKGF